MPRRTSWVNGATAAPLACAVCLATTAAYVAIDDPGDGDGGLTVCPYRTATGLWCPGCGLTRATYHLARGNVLHALSLNLLAPALLTALAVAWWTWFRMAAGRGVPLLVRGTRPPVYAALAVIVVAFTVIRNLPALDVLRGH